MSYTYVCLSNIDGVPRKQPADGHRERLLAGAVICLREKGYAHTTARDLVAASGTNLASIGYHFGGKDALLDEALAACFRAWTAQVEHAVFTSPTGGPRERLETALRAMIDAFEQQRPVIISCVEALPPAIRSAVLRDKLATAYAETRRAGADMIVRACADLGVPPPPAPEIIASVLVAICDGLMLQWLLDPDATPDARQVLDALTALAPFLLGDHT
jgi:AcrR family transcriptional regulator